MNDSIMLGLEKASEHISDNEGMSY